MAFIVEDGTGVEDANSLCAVEDADYYWADRASAPWAALTPAAKRAALIQASEYISQSVPWIGTKDFPNASLAWPRTALSAADLGLDLSGVPWRVVEATARLALAVAQGAELFGTVKASAGAIRYKAGSVEVQYSDEAARLALQGSPDFPWLMPFLAGYVDSASPASSQLNRKVHRV